MTLYIVIPVFICLFFIFFKNFIIEDKNFNKKKKFFSFCFFFLIPSSIFYLLIIVIEGFTITHWENLNLKFFILNLFNIIRDGFIPGFKNIFLNQHLDKYKYITDNNFFISLYNSLITNPLNTAGMDQQIEPQFTIITIYIISLIIILYRIFFLKLNYIDLILVNIFIFFYFLNYIPEPRVHVGIIFFNIFYIYDNVFNIYKKIKTHFAIILLLLLFTFYSLLKINIDEKFYTTKTSIDKIDALKNNHSCYELNYLLNDEEIWIMKNFYKKKCNYYYDDKNKKNILF
jgi:hypothetical protein